MKYILHIDTSTDIGTVAISGDGKLLAHTTNEETRNHAGAINNMINDLLTTEKISFSQLSAIDVCGGPGSYTGLRIGLATAKGLCYAMDLPLILDNRLTLLANHAYLRHQKKYDHYITLLTAREKEYFVSVYDNEFNNVLPPRHMMEAEVNSEIKITGNTYLITDTYQSFEPFNFTNLHIDNSLKIDLQSWVSLVFEKYNCNDIVNLSAAEPYYLKQVYTHK